VLYLSSASIMMNTQGKISSLSISWKLRMLGAGFEASSSALRLIIPSVPIKSRYDLRRTANSSACSVGQEIPGRPESDN
jgi:hypothetical protein